MPRRKVAEKTIDTHIRIPVSVHNKIAEVAVLNRRSVSAEIATALEWYCAQYNIDEEDGSSLSE